MNIDDPDIVTVLLSVEDRALVLRYGSPPEKLRASLAKLKGKREATAVPIDAVELGLIIGDLTHVVKKSENETLVKEMKDLCQRLEEAEQEGGD